MEKLGIQPSLLIAQIVNFVVIFFVLSKLLYKPILDMLEKRKKSIEENVKKTEAIDMELAKIEQKKTKVLEQAKKEGQDLIEEARKRAIGEADEIANQAHHEAQEIIDKAKSDGERIKKEMHQSVEKEAIDLALMMTKKLLGSIMGKDEQHKVITAHLKEIKSMRIS